MAAVAFQEDLGHLGGNACDMCPFVSPRAPSTMPCSQYMLIKISGQFGQITKISDSLFTVNVRKKVREILELPVKFALCLLHPIRMSEEGLSWGKEWV